MSIDADDGAHDVPDIFFPAPKYFVRSAERPTKVVLRLEREAGSDDESQHKHALKAAMGRELTNCCKKLRRTASMSQRTSDEWDRILDLESL